MNLFEFKRTYNEGVLLINEDAIESLKTDIEREGIKYYIRTRSGMEYQVTKQSLDIFISKLNK